MREMLGTALNHDYGAVDLSNETRDDIERLREHNTLLRAELSTLRLKMMEVEQMADMDPLLPVFNRRALVREISRAVSLRTRYDLVTSVIYLDLNNFKTINDNFGHKTGDNVLQSVVKVLQSNIRECDILARIGGDEFVILLFETDICKAKEKANSINIALKSYDVNQEVVISDHLQCQTPVKPLSFSWGVAECECDQSMDEILSIADRQMYMQKQDHA